MATETKQKSFFTRLLPQKKDRLILFSFLISTTLTHLIGKDTLNDNQSYVLFITIFAVLLWISEAVPPFSVGLLVIFLSVVLITNNEGDTINTAKFYQTWASPIIFLMLGGFFISSSMKSTGLDKELFNTALKLFGSNPNYIILGLMYTTAILSMIMSNTATTAMMIASVSPFVTKFGSKEPFTKAILIGIPAAAAVGGMGTIIGSPPNAIAVGALALQGIDINFVSWMIVGFPLALILVFVLWVIIIKTYKTNIKQIHIEEEQSDIAVSSSHRYITLTTIFATLILWLTTPFHGFHIAAIAALPMVIFTFLGILSSKDIQSLPWDTLILVAGGLTLGEAIQSTGLATHYINQISFNPDAYFLIFIAFAILTVVLSNIMSNTATTSLLIPIGILILPNNQIEIAVITGLSASCAILLPVSTPPNAIAFSTGLLKQSDFRKTGLLIGAIAPLLICIYITLLV